MSLTFINQKHIYFWSLLMQIDAISTVHRCCNWWCNWHYADVGYVTACAQRASFSQRTATTWMWGALDATHLTQKVSSMEGVATTAMCDHTWCATLIAFKKSMEEVGDLTPSQVWLHPPTWLPDAFSTMWSREQTCEYKFCLVWTQLLSNTLSSLFHQATIHSKWRSATREPKSRGCSAEVGMWTLSPVLGRKVGPQVHG